MPDWVWMPKTSSLYSQNLKRAPKRCSAVNKGSLGMDSQKNKACKAERELAQKVRVKVKRQYRHHWTRSVE